MNIQGMKTLLGMNKAMLADTTMSPEGLESITEGTFWKIE